MSVIDFTTNVLNIKQEVLEEIQTIATDNESIIINIKLKRTDVVCPICKGKVVIHDYYKRKLVHSIFAHKKCTINYKQRRYCCKVCGKTFPEHNPFINTKENVTYETKHNVLVDLKHPSHTYSDTARRYHLSTTKVMHIFDKHVNISRKTLPEILSIDEHFFPESDYNSLYCCLLMDFTTGEIMDVLPDRKKEYLANYLTIIKKETFNPLTLKSELDNVKYLSMDLSDNFRDIANTYFPNAIICADSFHVLKHLTEAFNKVRLRCRRNTTNDTLVYLLTKFKYVFNHRVNLDNPNKYNKVLQQRINHRGIRDLLFSKFPELKVAYELKELYINFNETEHLDSIATTLEQIIKLFATSGIEEYEEFYTLLTNWSTEITNSFAKIENRRINNSFIESKNRQIEILLYNANGFVNFKRARNRILYCLNKKDTYNL